MEDNNTTMMNQDNDESTLETNGLVGLAVKGIVGLVGLVSAYKLGKAKAEKSDKPKTKKKIHFPSPIVFIESEETEESYEEVKEEPEDK